MFTKKGTQSTSRTHPIRDAFVTTTKVVAWDPERGTQDDLDAFLRERRRDGWQIQTCVPRTLEGPRYGALVIMQKLTPARKRMVRKKALPVATPRSPAEKEGKRHREPLPVG